MIEPNAYQQCNFCPECGRKLELVSTPIDDIKQCKDHPLALYPAMNEHGEQVMVYDPQRPKRYESQFSKRG